jgi:putative flippase GtrA
MKETRLYGVARRNKYEILRIGKFAAVGLSGLVVDFVALNVLTYFFQFSEPLGISVAFALAATNNFIWNRLWVYPESRSEPKRKQIPVFLAVNTVGLGINHLIFWLFNATIDMALAGAPIALLARHHQGIGLNLTKAIAAVVVMVWNYVVNRKVTFRNVKWQRRDTTGVNRAL